MMIAFIYKKKSRYLRKKTKKGYNDHKLRVVKTHFYTVFIYMDACFI